MANFCDEKITELFESLIRYEGENSILVRGEANDFMLETDIVFVHPGIPREQVANIRYRFNVEDVVDGPFLCTVTDKRRDVPVDNCLITTRGVYWWDADTKTRHALSFRKIDMAYPAKDYPGRGLNLRLRAGEDKEPARFIRLYVHDAMLDALAGFICRACDLTARHTLDLNNATLAQLLQLPMLAGGRAEKLIAARETCGGFKNMREVGEALKLHPQELSALGDQSVLNRFRPQPRETGGRRVDF